MSYKAHNSKTTHQAKNREKKTNFVKNTSDLPFFSEMPLYKGFQDGRSLFETSLRPPLDLP